MAGFDDFLDTSEDDYFASLLSGIDKDLADILLFLIFRNRCLLSEIGHIMSSILDFSYGLYP